MWNESHDLRSPISLYTYSFVYSYIQPRNSVAAFSRKRRSWQVVFPGAKSSRHSNLGSRAVYCFIPFLHLLFFWLLLLMYRFFSFFFVSGARLSLGMK
ncbi:hypothetical protein BJX70DRAFT_374052 [Aspergillus crustosus]